MYNLYIDGKLIKEGAEPLQAQEIKVDGDVVTGFNNYRISFQLTGASGNIEISEVE